MISDNYEYVIGLEIHAQMLTRSKLFCGCSTQFGATANSQTCPVCSGFPGVLPVLNREAVNMTIRTGLAINGQVRLMSEFARKNYFYPDLPNGYQISQFELPIIEHGHVNIELTKGADKKKGGPMKRIGITRIHMEVDAGKNIHEGIVGASWVDLNRTGVPLMEIVSEPDIRTPEEAGEYLKKIRSIVRYLGACDGNMEQGSFRCDANVSIRRTGQAEFGTRAELKNLNSIRNVMRAIEYEGGRQEDLLESGGKVIQETRLWDPTKNESRSMRGKEEAHDYRYFPEPDLPPLIVTEERIEQLRAKMPELPDDKKERFREQYGLNAYDAGLLTGSQRLANYYETVAETVTKAGKSDNKIAANWVAVELLALLNKNSIDIDKSPVSAVNLGNLVALIINNTISGKIAKEVFAIMFETGEAPGKIVKEKGLEQVTDTGAIEAEVDQVLKKHAKEVEAYRDGKTKLLGFFVGQVMKATKGKASPKMVNELLRKKL
ncbi:MAG: Asp-tRNA(Asn)/Glu-tRNA(Gln) amidotransferase subunit GatB [Magnetococcales bacterium]|nr:Asp-tRNA(Asn)/Glu-tRNA(Gln) amidotransferase subunit GatB [Magnetococcales bacterium]